MKSVFRVAMGVVLTLAVFAGLVYLFIYSIFRFNYGHVRTDVFYVVACVLFVCSAFLVNIAWQAAWNHFVDKSSIKEH